MPKTGPTVVRRQLGRRLKNLRESSRVTVEQVEAAKFGSRTKLWRIERGQVRVTAADVRELCRIYRVDEADTRALVALAEGTVDQGWWHAYRDVVPDWFKLYVGLESAAARIHTFEDSVIPGELQTPDYSRALWHGAWPGLDDAAIAPHLNLRRQRQHTLLTRTPPPALAIVLGENVLRRRVGDAAIMAEQVTHLRELAERDNVDIRVLPFDAGAHPGGAGAFRILEFDDVDDPDVVYVELEVGAHYLEAPHELSTYRRIFTAVAERAVPIGDFTA